MNQQSCRHGSAMRTHLIKGLAPRGQVRMLLPLGAIQPVHDIVHTLFNLGLPHRLLAVEADLSSNVLTQRTFTGTSI